MASSSTTAESTPQPQAGEAQLASNASSPSSPRNATDVDRPPVFRVCLTGGPCAGKTTTAAVLSDRFRALGWNVYNVPEAASILLKGGSVNFYALDKDQRYEFQQSLLRLMISLESAFYEMAKSSRTRSIVLMDRGFLDASAYMTGDQWASVLESNKWDEIQMRDQRYDLVLHMVTCAHGAPTYYNSPGSPDTHRQESLVQAQSIDDKIKARWVGHPYFHVIDNQHRSFQQKIDQAVTIVKEFVGVQVAMSGLVKRKFLVKAIPEEIPIPHATYAVQHCYLAPDRHNKRIQSRLRSRECNGVTTYTLTVRRGSEQKRGQQVQIRRQVSKREFDALRMHRDASRNDVEKERKGFLYNDLYYEVDRYLNCQKGLVLLETYAPANEGIQLPPFIQVSKEVTRDPNYSMYRIAKKPNCKAAPQDGVNSHKLFGSFNMMK